MLTCFDGVEPDNMVPSPTEAYKRGLAIGQNNTPAADLVNLYDEDGFYYGWELSLRGYIAAGKPVFASEYTDLPHNRQSQQLGFSAICTHCNLDAWLQTCPPHRQKPSFTDKGMIKGKLSSSVYDYCALCFIAKPPYLPGT